LFSFTTGKDVPSEARCIEGLAAKAIPLDDRGTRKFCSGTTFLYSGHQPTSFPASLSLKTIQLTRLFIQLNFQFVN
jgi:hypothetical protein